MSPSIQPERTTESRPEVNSSHERSERPTASASFTLAVQDSPHAQQTIGLPLQAAVDSAPNVKSSAQADDTVNRPAQENIQPCTNFTFNFDFHMPEVRNAVVQQQEPAVENLERNRIVDRSRRRVLMGIILAVLLYVFADASTKIARVFGGLGFGKQILWGDCFSLLLYWTVHLTFFHLERRSSCA
jgi:hypothetical protein